MNFGIKKCATMVIRPETPLFQNKQDPTFYLAGQAIPKTNCYTYLGIPFDKTLSLDPIINCLSSKLENSIFSISNFLKNPRIPLPFKKTIINSFLIGKVSYFAPLLGSNKIRSKHAQKIINKALRWSIGIHNAKSFTSLYNLTKDLNIPPLSAKCALSQAKCFNKWQHSKCIISYIVKNICKPLNFSWSRTSSTLYNKLKKHRSTNAIKIFIGMIYTKILKKRNIM